MEKKSRAHKNWGGAEPGGGGGGRSTRSKPSTGSPPKTVKKKGKEIATDRKKTPTRWKKRKKGN